MSCCSWKNGAMRMPWQRMEGSRITVMTLIKQSGCIVTIIGGRIFFHEKNTLYKLICAGIILAGIVIAVI